MSRVDDDNNSSLNPPEVRQASKVQRASSAIQASKGLAAVAMKGSNPWQKLVVYACFGVIAGSLFVLGLPPFDSSKQLTVFGILSSNLLVSVIFVFLRYNSLVQPGKKSRARSSVSTDLNTFSRPKVHPSFAVAWIVAIAVCFVFIFGSRITGYDPLWIAFPSWNQSMQSGFLIRGITDGIRRDRDFVIEAVTVLVKIEDSRGNNPTQRRTTVRTFYTLRALKDISTDSVVFTEEYSSTDDEEVVYWNGSHSQRLTADTAQIKKFDVLFNAKRGENHTVVTGATFISKLPLVERQDGGIRFAPNEDMAFYPNHSDAVCEVTIIVESTTSRFKLAQPSAIRYLRNGTIQESAAASYSKDGNAVDSTLSARWTDVLAGEVVGLKFSW